MIGGTFEDLEEAIGESVRDSAVEAIEQTTQVANPPTQQQIQDKQLAKQEEQIRQYKLKQWRENLKAAQAKARAENEQKEKMRLQKMEQQEQIKKQEKVVGKQSKNQQLVAQAQQNEMVESKPNKGHA